MISPDPNAEQEMLLADSVMIYGGLVFCETCSKEACPQALVFTDEQYAKAAHRLVLEGWTTTNVLTVYCPECSPK
jgi:hypothetical protein